MNTTIFKKTAPVFLCILLAAVSAGCQKNNNDKEPDASETTTEATTEEETYTNPSTIDGTLLYESERMKITFINETKDERNINLNFSVENYTDEQLMLAANNISIAGRMFDPFLYSVCPGNETTAASMSFSIFELEKACIPELTEVDFSFFITDGSSPDGLESSDTMTLKLRSGESPLKIEGEEIASDNDMNVSFVEAVPSELNAGYLCIYVENLTGQDIFVDIKDICIDGVYTSAAMYEPINAGMDKLCYADLSEEGILTEDSKEITFNLGLIDPDTYEAVAETGNVTVDIVLGE